MNRWVLGAAAALCAMRAGAATGPIFQADFSNPAASPAHWTLTLKPDGTGHFRSERGNAPSSDPPVLEAPDLDRDVKVSEEFARHVFHEAHEHSGQSKDCESHMKVAFQGWKKLTYLGPEGEWTCEFNYSRDRQIQELGESLLAVASTILEGARLEALLLHDRLGLDREMEFISEASGDGRMAELGVIRGVLKRLADDDEVMERVRKRAGLLLAKADR